MEQQVSAEKKRWWIAGVFSFLVPGLGQLYNGKSVRGLIYFFLIFSLTVVFYPSLFHHMDNPDILTRSTVIFLIMMLYAIFLLSLLSIIDAICSAIKAGAGRKPIFYNRWSIYVSILVVFYGFNYLKPFIMPERPTFFDMVEAFKIPSGSMQPSIEVGDYLVCNRMYYLSHNPQRGDIIIFKNPRDENVDYIKRVVGLPGDTIELWQNTLFVNGQEIDEPYAVYGGDGSRPGRMAQSYGPYFIPENEYFVMGDNRDNSLDSRKFGTVEGKSIQGKAIFIYFSWDMDIPAWNIPTKLASIRFSRIGAVL